MTSKQTQVPKVVEIMSAASHAVHPLPEHETVRKLQPRHVALIGIGGSVLTTISTASNMTNRKRTIGTAMFIAIGSGLTAGGPGSLFLAFVIWSTVIYSVNLATAELVTYLPLPSPFIRLSGRFIDPAIAIATGYNFFICQSVLVAFEITASTVIIRFWDTQGVVPKSLWIVVSIALYSALNLITVEYYGESEFWLAISKVFLAIALLLMTFVLMIGGNPQHDAFGFRYWRNPGAFAEYIKPGPTGHFLGFFQCLVTAAFIVAGPEVLSMTAGEAVNPRKTMKEAYRTVVARLIVFFVLGSLAVGILVPYDDEHLIDAINGGKPGAAKSPYVIALDRLHVPVMPHIINALILLSTFSAGNSMLFCASRVLHGLALEGHAPRVFAKCNRRGVPVYAVLVVLGLSLLAFLAVNKSSTVVLNWFINMVTSCELINFIVMLSTYLRFYQALACQGISRSSLPYMSRLNPYTAYYALSMLIMMIVSQGYANFIPGHWDLSSFFFSYAMLGIFATFYLAWKTIKRTHLVQITDMDLISGLAEVVEHEKFYKRADGGESSGCEQDKSQVSWPSKVCRIFF